MQDILSTLPNEENNPLQSDLYKAFKEGNVQKVLKTERNERMQIFITGMSIRFSQDIYATGFGEQEISRRESTSVEVSPARDNLMNQQRFVEEMMRRRLGTNVEEKTSDQEQLAAEEEALEAAKKTTPLVESKCGFVVTIVGYSPYKDYEQLLDPPSVGQDMQKWGFVTRLKNLKAVDSNCPFEIFNVTDRNHFDLTKDVVALDTTMPAGIGVEDQRIIKRKSQPKQNIQLYGPRFSIDQQEETIEKILIDPMTREIISRVRKYNEDGSPAIDKNTGKPHYEINDHWFELKLKFRWINAPERVKALAGQK
jgi:hypothetical protein